MLAVPQLLEQLYGRNVRHVTVAGIEAHVCVAQTALELLDLGFRVQVPADAVASRRKIDWEFALRRLEQAGAVVSTTESVLFEWTETADRPEFKAISELDQVTRSGWDRHEADRPFALLNRADCGLCRSPMRTTGRWWSKPTWRGGL